jgi:hypothetical protein
MMSQPLIVWRALDSTALQQCLPEAQLTGYTPPNFVAR